MATCEEDEQSLNDSFVDEPSGDESDDSIANILKRLPTGAVVKKKEQIYHCHKCNIQFSQREEQLTHLMQHVTMPLLTLDKIDDDYADQEDEDDDDWSEDDLDDIDIDTKPIKIISKETSSTFNKILNSNIIIKKTGFVSQATKISVAPSAFPNLSIKKLQNKDDPANNDSKTEENSSQPAIKITIKHDAKENNFHVVNEGCKETEKKSPELPKENAETVDSKEGILESIKIKNEPIDNGPVFDSKKQNDVPQRTIKREIPSPTNSAALYKEMQEKNLAEQKKLAQQPKITEHSIVPKKEPEDQSCTIIEINGDDSDNDDDDLIFVSSSPPPDKKPKITELSPAPSNTMNQNNYTSTNQNNNSTSDSSNKNSDWSNLETFDAMLSEKNTEAILKSLLDDHNLKEASGNDYGTSEYISLDKLGPQYSCDVCNTKFTHNYLLEDHIKATGHSKEIVLSTPSSSSLLPSYNKPDMGLMNSFFPVKQIAETVGKLTSTNPNNAFTHQQNIMVNIQSFPGGMNQPYTPDTHASAAMHSGYPPGYRMPSHQPPYNPQFPQQFNPNNYPYSGGMQQPRDYQTNAPYMHGYPQPMPQQPPLGHPPNHYLMGSHPQAPPNNMNSPYQNYPPGTIISENGQPSPHSQMLLSGGNYKLPNVSGAQLNSQLAPSVQSTASSIPLSSSSISMASNVKIAPSVQPQRPQIRPSTRGTRGRGGATRGGMRPTISPSAQARRAAGSVIRPAFKQANQTNGGGSPVKKRLDMLMPSRHDSDDCEAVSIQHQKEGIPIIQNIQGSKEKPVQLNSQITVTKKKVRPPTPPPVAKDANTVASMLARRGIKITQKAKSPSPPPINIPNLGSGISITHTKASSASDDSKDIFTQRSLKCDSCPISYPTATQLQEHKRHFHSSSASDLGLPVVDLSQQATIRKLSSLGINNFIPLANREQGGGCFGIPIVSVQNVMSGSAVNSLHALGLNGILSLGPVKPLPKC